jgi:Bacteriophage tail tube protein
MPNPILVMDYANMFCGSGPTNDKNSNHLTLTQVQLPTMDIQYVDHRPGGAPVATEIDVQMARFEVKFQLIGIVRQVWSLLLRLDPTANDFWIYGNVRDYLTGETLQAEAYVQGQLAAVEPSAFKRGEVMHTEYTIRGIRKYTFKLANSPIYDWDFFQNTWSVAGFNQSGASTTGAE